MGNNNSQLKIKESKSNKLPKSNSDKSLINATNEYTDRQHTHHFIRKHLFQGNFSAPVEEKLIQGCDVLDVACGPGTWLLDLANKYKNSQFCGLDIKSAFPQKIKPSNLNFIVADMFKGLPFHDNKFDFVHMETVSVVLSGDQWDFAFSELIRVVKPGGYIESTEPIYCPIKETNSMAFKVQQAICNSFLKLGNVDIKSTGKISSILESKQNIGKVYRDEKPFTFGPKGGKIGLTYQDILLSFYSTKPFSDIIMNEMRISEEDYKNVIEVIIEELKTIDVNGLLLRIWAQKNY